MTDHPLPRRFLIRRADQLVVGEGIQFTTGHIVVWWHLGADRPEGLWAAAGLEHLDLDVPAPGGLTLVWLDTEEEHHAD